MPFSLSSHPLQISLFAFRIIVAFSALHPLFFLYPCGKLTAIEARPLSINLATVRRTLNLTPEEFGRPLPIEDGESLITRLETGFSRASAAVLDLICDAWGINRKYLRTGQGEMFDPGADYCSALTTLLKKYLAVATFDGKGQQYWKGIIG